MLRKQESIPNFIKEFKEDFFSYVLNLNEEDSQNLLKDKVELTDKQNQVLDEIIKNCRSLKSQYINETCTHSSFYLTLRGHIINKKTHVFNHWRLQCGGKTLKTENQDQLIHMFQVLGIEAYPAFLLNDPMWGGDMGIDISSKHKLVRVLTEQIITDTQLKLLFNIKGKSVTDTYYSYKTSTGQAFSIKLASFIDLVLSNSYSLMILEGQDDIASYLKSIEANVKLLREIAVNKKADVPVCFGYSNVSFPKNTSIEIPQGQLMSFDKKFLKILPQYARPALSDGSILSAFIYKGNYSCVFEFQDEEERKGEFKFPKKPVQFLKRITQIDEDLKLALSLSCKRNPVVILGHKWTVVFDPLSYGTNFSVNVDNIYATPPHVCSEEEINGIKEWSEKIYKTDDSKIRLAIRKIVNSISNRENPVDSFIDGIIAWENLFGANNHEINFRISSAISCLLEKEKSKRKELFKKLKETYVIRSKIIHGVKEIRYEKAVEFRDFVIEISLACISEIYENYPELIVVSDRSLTILLEHE